MEIIPWRPMGRELSSLHQEMDRLWDRFMGETPLVRRITGEWWPTVDVSETKDNFVIKAELPGMDASDVNVSVSGNVLTIKGEKRKEEEEKDEHHYRAERYYGSFQRSFQLPASMQAEKVEATFDKGVLRVILPKVEEAKKKEVTIKVKTDK
ncbi:MAG: Hsp20/alpha crystallin family protein [Desulfobacterales bacterium]|nr:Hsp20/alpha crystallin family protein [Desulfobacterales bacterium]